MIVCEATNCQVVSYLGTYCPACWGSAERPVPGLPLRDDRDHPKVAPADDHRPAHRNALAG